MAIISGHNRANHAAVVLVLTDSRCYFLSMKQLFLLLLAVATPAMAGILPETYAPFGELIVTKLNSAPFPHPLRAEGHRYKDQIFSAKEHYSDSTVAIFIPKGFEAGDRIDFVVHFHGWKNNVEGVLKGYEIVEQLSESRRNAILVVPQGPRDASDSFGGKLEDPEGFKRFMDDVTGTLREKAGFRKEFSTGRIVLSGHSGGYQVISSILDRGGLSDKVREVWLFDALYAQTDKFLAWMYKEPGRLINIYTEHGGTKNETEQLIRKLQTRGTHIFAAKEAEAKSSDLRTNHFVFLYSDLEHNDVLDKHRTFRDFLKTSCLGEIREGSPQPNSAGASSTGIAPSKN